MSIKRELKQLYKKDKNLAAQAAKVLGYKIVAKKEEGGGNLKLEKAFTDLANLVGGMSKPKSAMTDTLTQLNALTAVKATTLEKTLSAAYKALYKLSAKS